MLPELPPAIVLKICMCFGNASDLGNVFGVCRAIAQLAEDEHIVSADIVGVRAKDTSAAQERLAAHACIVAMFHAHSDALGCVSPTVSPTT